VGFSMSGVSDCADAAAGCHKISRPHTGSARH
jgi:hypothetical protein